MHGSSSHVAINVHGNYCYIVEGSPHLWLTCRIINVEGSSAHTHELCVAINTHGSSHVAIYMHSNHYIWWRGPLTCGSCVAINVHGSSRVAINVHSNHYMVEGDPSCVAHMWQLTCMVITRIWWRGAIMYLLMCSN